LNFKQRAFTKRIGGLWFETRGAAALLTMRVWQVVSEPGVVERLFANGSGLILRSGVFAASLTSFCGAAFWPRREECVTT
jgi:hypothetical protein